ncbi:MAG: muramoyltetrapeptide carboxypeptidase [Proteobacteria bacterium]|nr:muramoyltetrapeptide carboxypeptidase [Pseudomonadota bacterium]
MSAYKPQLPAQLGVAIVAPGGYAPDEAALMRGIALLEAQGCCVHNYYNPRQKHQRFGGTDEARVAQLHAAAANPDVKIVLALRAGYGMTRILPALDLDLLAHSGKLFVGYSDFTALQMALLKRNGTITFAGPMMCDDFNREDVSSFTMSHFWRCMTQDTQVIEWTADGNPAVDVAGTLWGNNLAMLVNLLGTPYFPQIDGGILFLEDINEHPFRIERMLLQLESAGVLARQKAIVLGDFSGGRLSDYDNGYNFDTMLAYLRARFSLPVLTGLPFGHIRDKLTLPIGAQARLEAQGSSLRLTLSGYPVLRQFSTV